MSGSEAGAGAVAADPGNDLIQEQAPGLWRALSALGRRVRQPEDFLPLQSAEARGKPFNATIGQITDGHGHAVELPALAAALAALPAAERSRALLYSPLEGLPELRQRWRERQLRRWQGPLGPLPPLPLVTSGPGLAREVLAELFVEEGRTVVLPLPPPAGLEGARELFELRRGARLLELRAGPGGEGESGDGGSWPAPDALGEALDRLPAGEPVVVVLLAGGGQGASRWAGGENATGAGFRRLREVLTAVAAERPVIALVEDGPAQADDESEAAATGADSPAEGVLDAGAGDRSQTEGAGAGRNAGDRSSAEDAGADATAAAGACLFRELIGRHPDLMPFRVEGTAKLGFPGAGLGFLTLPYDAGTPLAVEIEKRLKMLLRAAVGSPPALTQVLLLAALGPAGAEPRMGFPEDRGRPARG
jgi:hypothetical protein